MTNEKGNVIKEEKFCNTKERFREFLREVKTNRDLTLEHIFPESKKSEISNPSMVYRIGNLTLG